MLPGRDGMEICKEIRSFSTVPIIMVTARIEEIDRLLGLELGADDYICKPYSPREVVARVKAVLRRTDGRQGLRAAGLCLAEETLGATLNGQELSLTAVEFKLLQHLAAHPGRIFSRPYQKTAQEDPDHRPGNRPHPFRLRGRLQIRTERLNNNRALSTLIRYSRISISAFFCRLSAHSLMASSRLASINCLRISSRTLSKLRISPALRSSTRRI